MKDEWRERSNNKLIGIHFCIGNFLEFLWDGRPARSARAGKMPTPPKLKLTATKLHIA
ncbi:MAG: hypothetical protein HC865_09990 [Cyanobacteria bacterium RU_5_0]|nr:hypothetical protein [Cyanobacteria bacterium RU_5_0]